MAESVVARAPAKINLALHVGSPDSSGYHPLLTAFQAIDLWETVTIRHAPALEVRVEGAGLQSTVPTGPANTAWRAAELLAQATGHEPLVSIEIDKRIPVAGGMAGGSADAAATLVALNEYWNLDWGFSELAEVARMIGADVAFSLLGGSAIGRGRGDELEKVEAAGRLHWVVIPSSGQLSTPTVYRKFDGLYPESRGVPVGLDENFLRAWRTGDAPALASLILNDLQEPACQLLPGLRQVLADSDQAGAIASIVSGSGPTVLGLAESADHAGRVAYALENAGYRPIVTQSIDSGSVVVRQPPIQGMPN